MGREPRSLRVFYRMGSPTCDRRIYRIRELRLKESSLAVWALSVPIRPFVLCCSSCVQQPNTVRLLCRRDFLRRSQNHGLHSFVEVPPELRSTNFPGRIGVFLRLQQFVPLDLCTSSRATNTYDRFNKPSGITNSAVNIGMT